MVMDGFSDSGRNMQKLQSSSVQRPPSYFDLPFLNAPQMGAQMRPSLLNLSPDNVGKRPGMPPPHPNNPGTSPYSQIVGSRPNSPLPASQNSKHGPSHCRSLSQPSFFSLDSLPPLSPSPYREASVPSPSEATSADVPMEDRSANLGVRRNATAMGGGNEFGVGESFPPRKGHRRSCSDISMGFSAMFQSSPQLMSVGSRGAIDRSGYGKESPAMEKPIQLVKRESESSKDGHGNAEGMGERKSEGEVADDLFNAYMNLDNIDTLNSSGTDDKDLDSRASGTKTNGVESSDNEVESGVNGYPVGMQGTSSHISNDKREGLKRGATGDIAPTARHYRSVSMDSYMGTLQFDDESIKLPLGNHAGQLSPGNSADGKSSKFNLEFGNGEFTPSEMKKIMENDKLAEMASVDPKRVKRILANRQSAARSKERKMRYIAELEHKVQTLQTEATTLSAQLTMLQRDSAGLTNQNNELKFRLQAMEQQAQLKDALNEALAAEVQRLKLAAAELSGEAHLSNRMAQQLTINPQMFQLQSRQAGGYQLPEQGSQPSQLESQKAQAGDQSQIQRQNSEHPADELKS